MGTSFQFQLHAISKSHDPRNPISPLGKILETAILNSRNDQRIPNFVLLIRNSNIFIFPMNIFRHGIDRLEIIWD